MLIFLYFFDRPSGCRVPAPKRSLGKVHFGPPLWAKKDTLNYVCYFSIRFVEGVS
jgi:hypothetical protein